MLKHVVVLGGVSVLLLAVPLAEPVSAQRPGYWYWNIQYSTVLPSGDATRSYIDEFSWRGATLDLRRAVNENVSVGLSSGWHVLDKQGSGTLVFDQGALSGTALRYVNAVPVLALAAYHFGDRGRPRPFVGVGAGTYYVKNRTEAGVFVVEGSNWHWGLAGEAGIALPRPGGTAITLVARYNWAVKRDGIERQYFTFSLGYAIRN